MSKASKNTSKTIFQIIEIVTMLLEGVSKVSKMNNS